jgi:hypothetical protein
MREAHLGFTWPMPKELRSVGSTGRMSFARVKRVIDPSSERSPNPNTSAHLFLHTVEVRDPFQQAFWPLFGKAGERGRPDLMEYFKGPVEISDWAPEATAAIAKPSIAETWRKKHPVSS